MFPGVKVPVAENVILNQQIDRSFCSLGLEPVDTLAIKVTQLFDTFNVRFGVMLVGPTASGKSTAYRVLADAMTKLKGRDDRY